MVSVAAAAVAPNWAFHVLKSQGLGSNTCLRTFQLHGAAGEAPAGGRRRGDSVRAARGRVLPQAGLVVVHLPGAEPGGEQGRAAASAPRHAGRRLQGAPSACIRFRV